MHHHALGSAAAGLLDSTGRLPQALQSADASPVAAATRLPTLAALPATAAAAASPTALALGLALVARAWNRRRGSTLLRGELQQKQRRLALGRLQRQASTLEVTAPPVEAAYQRSLFSDVLEVKVPKQLDTFLNLLKAGDYTLLGKEDWKAIVASGDVDLHPFILPLGTRGEGDDLEVCGLMIRAPRGAYLAPDKYQVVSQKPRVSKNIQLIALDVDQYIKKLAEEATFRQEKQDLPIIEVVKDVYDVQFKGDSKTALDKWLLLEVGAFPEIYMNLAREHLENGDPRSALCCADTMREKFGDWAFCHAFVSAMLRDNYGKEGFEDRGVEAQQTAQMCLTSGYPLYTLEDGGDSLSELLAFAEVPKLPDIDSLRVFYLKRVVDDQRSAVRTGNISLGCAALGKAQALLDAVSCGHKSFNGVREEIAELYEEVPNCEPLVEMIYHFKQ